MAVAGGNGPVVDVSFLSSLANSCVEVGGTLGSHHGGCLYHSYTSLFTVPFPRTMYLLCMQHREREGSRGVASQTLSSLGRSYPKTASDDASR